jgi:hypothetical protein
MNYHTVILSYWPNFLFNHDMSIPAFINSFLSHYLSSFDVRNSLQLQTKSNFLSRLQDIGALCWDICQSELPYHIDLCSACSLLSYDWSVDLLFGLHVPRETFELWTGYPLFVAVDKLILLLWDYNHVWRWQTCCFINCNLYIVIYKFA